MVKANAMSYLDFLPPPAHTLSFSPHPPPTHISKFQFKMAKLGLIFISIVMVFIISKTKLVEADDTKCFRPTAAFNYYGNVYLVEDKKVITLNSNLEEESSGNMGDMFGYKRNHLDAALVSSVDGYLYFFDNNRYTYYSSWYSPAPGDISDWGYFFIGGIDAAGVLQNVNYFFNGCFFITSLSNVEKDVNSIGLPCNVDSVFEHNDQLYVTKSSQVWILNDPNGDQNISTSGPERLAAVVTLMSSSFCELNDSAEQMVLDEQAYEKEHQCTIIDAALTWKDRLYMFNDNRYVTLDENRVEVYKDNILWWGGLPPNIDAGIIWSGNGAMYFFKGYGYYKYYYDEFFVNVAMGPFTNSAWGTFFENGIDAAANLNGTSFFFKGCQIAQYGGPESKVNAMFNVTDIQVPCNVDVAFSVDESMYVVKRNQAWVVTSMGIPADGPKPLSSVVTLKTWAVCAPDNN